MFYLKSASAVVCVDLRVADRITFLFFSTFVLLVMLSILNLPIVFADPRPPIMPTSPECLCGRIVQL